MPAIRRILVAIKDPRAKSLHTVAKAAQLARALKASLRIFHGINDPIYLDMAGFTQPLELIEQERREACKQQLERIAARLRRLGITVSTAVEWDFPAYEAILRGAREFNADLIVAECHATNHRAPWLLRFTDWELLRTSAVPVLLVKNRRPYRRPRVLAAVDPTHAFAKPAKLDAQILRSGATVANALGGALHVVYAFDPLPLQLIPDAPTQPAIFEQIESLTVARAKTALDRTLRALKLPPDRRHVIGRHPIDAIADAAAETTSSIVVMGAVSRSGLKRVFIGNTAEKLLDRLPCDVLVVKPPHFRSPIGRARRGAQVLAAPVVAPGL
ncbi:MAG TPA: universal stress protein [Steroidobacteraceae bacterium]|nr:universal stress protein [Steroidobacteraceae bacterium]